MALSPDQERIRRELAELRTRIGTVPAPDLASRLEALTADVSGLRADIAAAYDAAGLSEPARPVLRVIEGGAA